MINDVVSGFFILFENIYLVGDIIEAGPARGTVEAIEFRTTKIRDADGRLHILRNGDMKVGSSFSLQLSTTSGRAAAHQE
jgi:moderate conductance mechanosensitive channel